jgi:hypothetical protein
MARALSRDTSPSSKRLPKYPPKPTEINQPHARTMYLQWPAEGYITPLEQIILRFCAIPQKHYKSDASHVGVVTRSERRVLRTPCNRSPSPLVLEADSRRLSKSCGNLTLKPVMELPFDSSTLSLMWLIRNRNLAYKPDGAAPTVAALRGSQRHYVYHLDATTSFDNFSSHAVTTVLRLRL